MNTSELQYDELNEIIAKLVDITSEETEEKNYYIQKVLL